MREIHKIAAVVIKDNSIFMVRKKGADIWTGLGGRPEAGETEEQTLLREIDEEVHCGAKIIRKLGDFVAKAVHDDDAMIRLSSYLVELQGEVRLDDPELEEWRYVPKNYQELGIKLPPSIVEHLIPFCVKEGLLTW